MQKGAYGGQSSTPDTPTSVVVWGFREDALQLQGSKAIAWNVLALAQPPQLGEAAAVLHWKVHLCSAKSQVSDWAVGDRNTWRSVLAASRNPSSPTLTLRTGILTLEVEVAKGAWLPVSWSSAKIELLHVARPFSICAAHRSPDAVELCSCLCPEAYAACLRQTREEPIVVTTPEEYAEAWRGLVEVEAAASAVEEGLGRHLTDVWVDWEESEGVTYGRFEVKAALLFAHKIKFRSAMPLGEWGSSWLCVRRHLKGGGVPWHGHGAVIKASFDEKDLIFAEEDDTWQDSGSSLRITFRVIATAPRRSGENGLASGYAPPVNGFYLLELIPKALAESCMALALEELPHCPLVQRLVLAGPSDERSLAPAPEVVEVAALLDSLNDSQRRAVHYALRHPLAQVQGPPGTGKTMTTAVLATCFAWQNMSSGENRAVLLCTPTNRAADCAASFVARVCRRYAERRLEARSAEGTQCAVCLGGKPNTITLCGHPFHQSCLAQALELGSRCPICRRRVKHIETGLRILRIYGAEIEKQEFPVPKRNEHAGLEARKVFEVPEELRRFSLHWRCHGASDDEHCTAEARKTRKAYREMIQHGTKGPRADQLRRTYQQALQEARKAELREADIVFSTCVSCRRMAIAQALSEDGAPSFWQVILDEAGQATEPEALCPLTFATRAQQICLFGDQQQLRPILKSSLAETCGMGISLFERLTMAEEPQFLAMQYRMTPAISAFPSSRFYQGRLQDDASVLGSPTLLQHPSKDRSMPLIFWQTSLEGPGERVSHLRTVDNSAGSRLNETEAQQAVDLASALASACGPGCGNLCWYRAQVARVEQLLREKSLSQLHVGSVATAQGSEWDYVILSTVRRGGASMQGRLGILADGHILNVALTRARRGLVVLGDSATLSTDPNWKAFLDHCRQQDVLVDSVPRLTSDEALWSDAWQRALVPGFKVELCQLQSQPELNGKIGTVCCSGENGRWEVMLQQGEETRRLALKPKNLQMVKEPQLAPSPGATKGKPAFGGLNALVAAEQPRSGVEFSTTLRFAAQQLQPQVTRCGKEVTVVDRSSPCHGMKGIVRSRGGDSVSVEFSKSFCMQQGPVQVRPGQKGLEVSAQGSLEHLLKPGLVVMLHGLKSKPELNAEWARVVSEEPSEGRWEVDLLSDGAARRLAMKPENLAPEL